MASTKKNFGYTLTLTLAGYIFPLITYPYVSRVLGVTNLGTCNFIDGIIGYFVLFANMGIGSYGVREIARFTDDKKKRDDVFSNLFTISLITTGISLGVLIVCTYTVPTMIAYKPFLGIGATKLVFNLFAVNWFFEGISDFRYITIRSIAIRMLYVIAVFIFVHDKGDTLIYYALTTGTVVINSIVNWCYGKKYWLLSFKNIHLNDFLKPVLTFGFYLIVTSMYTSFNTVFLGFVSNNTEVGYFTTATKLYSIIMAVFSSFTTVMVPRVAKLLKDKNFEHLQKVASDTFALIIMFAIPIIAFCELNANDIILILSGKGFEGAITPFRIVILLLLIIGFEQIIIQQFLMASSSNKAVLSVGVVGVIVGVSMNIIFTPHYGAIGSSVAWGLSEFGVLCSGIYLVKRVLHLSFNKKMILKKTEESIIFFAPFILLAIPINHWIVFTGSAIYLIIAFIWLNLHRDKNKYVVEIWNKFFGKFHRINCLK
jgi:O-antigen/teichoic acid export membrane protein